ncbi:putative ribonuclease H-like domain-containing protein [Tanacetum coccineum]
MADVLFRLERNEIQDAENESRVKTLETNHANEGALALALKNLRHYIYGIRNPSLEGLHKGFDRFQSLLSQSEIHGTGVSTEDANQKFLRVFESDVKGSAASSSSTQNVAFISENTSSTNDVSTAYGVSTSTGHNSQCENNPSSYSFLANQSSCRKLQFDAKEPVGFDKTNVECYNCHKTGHFARECRFKGNQDSRGRDAWNTGNKDKDNERRSEAEKEKEELKAKVEKWHNSSKSLNILLNSQMSARDKAGLGYGDQMNKGVLSYENEVFGSLFNSRSSDIEDSPVNDRYAEGMHAVPPPMTGIYIPSGPDKEIDDSQFTYGPRQSKPSESDARISDFNSCESNSSEETLESMPEPVVNEPKVVSQPKVWSDALIIEKYESDSDDENVSLPTKEQEKPSFAFVNTVKHVKTPRQTVKEQNTCSQSPKPDKKDCSALMSKKLVVPTNADRKVHTVKPIVNYVRPKNVFHKTYSPIRRPFNRTTTLRTIFSNPKVNTADVKAVSAVWGKRETVVKPSDYPQRALKDKAIVDSGCSRHMTGNKAYLTEYQEFNGGLIAFGGSKGYITGKGKIKTRKLDFKDVCFVKELQHFNLFSVSQMCDKKNKVLFTDTEYLVLSPEFKLPDENQVLLRVPRQNNMYSFNLENIVPFGGLACLIAKATVDESNKWHRRLGHVNFKNLNKLVKGNLVRGLPSKIFQNDHTCVACQKGKQHKASCKAKSVSSISQPLQLLHMDLFGPTSVRSINHKTYCLVITDDFSRFSWVFFLRTKDETSGILKDFIRQIENQLNQKVKTIRCDNGTEFKNRDFIEFCGSKGIKREYSNARTPQQNGVAERKNRTLIEAARTMLADSFLPNTFWAEAVSTACYVLNRVLVTKPQNKTPYELITGKIPIISYIRPFGCHVTILNTIDHLGKFDGKSDEGFLVGYSLNSKAFRVYNLETKRVEENLHITFLENKPNVAGKGPNWLFDLDYLTDSMNYQPVRSENQANKHAGPKEANHSAGTQDNIDAGNSEMEAESAQDYFVLPIWSSYTSTVKSSEAKNEEKEANDAAEALRKEFAQDTKDLLLQAGAARASSTNTVNTASTPVSTASPSGGLSYTDLTNTDQDDSEIPTLEDSYDNPNDDFPYEKKAIGTKWVYRNKKNKRGVVVRNKVRLVAQGHRQEEGIDYDEVFDHVARIEAIRIFLAFASYMGFIVYQMDVKSAFLYGTIDEEVYVSQPPGFIDPKCPKKVYKVVKALYGLHEAPRACVKTTSTPIETHKPLVKDEEATNVDVHLYRSMIGSLMYLTAFWPDIMFAVCACSRFQVTPKTSHLNAVKRIFRRLISWQCKKHTIVANFLLIARRNMSAAANASWASFVDSKSNNPVFHSKTKSILNIMAHFFRDAYEKKLIQVLKIHTNDNVADLLTKAFDVSSLDFCSKHNMVAYLEKNDGNTEFNQIIDFLTYSLIHFGLTVSPIVSTSFVEQFWTSAKSRTVNNISYINAIIAGKPVTISEASIRSDLLFDDADGIDTLNNQGYI